jgi:dienelactone hydrolase
MIASEPHPKPKLPEPKRINLRRKFLNWISRNWQKLYPSPPVRKGAAFSLFIVVLILTVLSGMSMRLGFSGVFNALTGILIYLVMAAVIGFLFYFLLKVLFILPRFLTFFGVVIFGLFLFIMMNYPVPNALLTALLIGFAEALLGSACARFFKGRFGQENWPKRIYILSILLITVALNVYLVYWFLNRGSDQHLVEWKAKAVQVEPLEMPDSSQPGSFEVKRLTYGSGKDKHRPEFGEEVTLTTESVDAGPFVKGSKGWRMKLRKWFWGFDFAQFPRNGRVWYPEGEGPFPLILCVHGNHNMAEFSDPGYGYLGQLFASRGFIFVSVDENFFNGHFFGGLKTENDGRGWMLLQHLKIWREWNETEEHLFHAKVDLGNIGLIGHSRGGEAAAVAGLFNRLSRYPDDATVEFDFDFAIKAIVAIAPSDGQYKPAGRPTPLENVNYLTIQGAHDADVSSFAGARQYNRVKFTDGNYRFKSYIYSYRSNHGQFNTVWGDNDWGKPWGMVLNRNALLDGERQRKIGAVYMSAFFEVALKGNRGYIPLFRDFRRIQEWLPDDIYINRFEDSTFRVVSDFEEDVDVTSTTLEGGVIKGKNLAVWREENLGFRRRGTKDNNVAVIGWKHPESKKSESVSEQTEGNEPEQEEASYAIKFPEKALSGLGLNADSVLVFSLAEADEKPPKPEDEDDARNGNDPERPRDGEKDKETLEMSVELVDANGKTARLALSRFRAVPPILKSKFTKFRNEGKFYGKAYEPTLQVFELPMTDFVKAFPGFHPEQLKIIRFVFDRSPEGVILLDRVGFANPI